MNVQSLIISILSILIIIVAFTIVLVGTIGILRIVVASVFEFDFIKWFKNRKNEKTKTINEQRIEQGLEPLEDLPMIYKMNLKEKNEQDNSES